MSLFTKHLPAVFDSLAIALYVKCACASPSSFQLSKASQLGNSFVCCTVNEQVLEFEYTPHINLVYFLYILSSHAVSSSVP